MDEILKQLKPLYKNSLEYPSKDWRLRDECTVDFPVQRKLCRGEIVADFDDLKCQVVDLGIIRDWFLGHNFKFVIYTSSDTGLHVHFFTHLNSKYQKVGLLKEIQEKIGYKIDTNPTSSGVIRAEDSLHPKKQHYKSEVYSNLNVFFYINDLDASIIQKLSKYEPTDHQDAIETDLPRYMKQILNGVFGNGRKRLMFCVVSWWKSRGLDKETIFSLTKDWISKQPNCNVPDGQLWATIYSSTGMVREKHRKELLEELGFPVN